MNIYTLGYSGWKIEEVEAVLQQLDALLVDVRMIPRTRWTPLWNGAALYARLGTGYVWLREFGNVNYKGTFEQIQIANFPLGMKRLADLSGLPFDGAKNVVLMCGCRDVNVCHRKVLAERLAKEWTLEIVHLSPPAREVAKEPKLF
ncbi:MAG: DUF488 domain-containing protein [Acidobacteria bacterium]|nr:DUF488 domain-containing protein [Planctomycetota bacterium]MBE3133655.1 DUF488 domain-containing protein [Acidobacteriota bacterium]